MDPNPLVICLTQNPNATAATAMKKRRHFSFLFEGNMTGKKSPKGKDTLDVDEHFHKGAVNATGFEY